MPFRPSVSLKVEDGSTMGAYVAAPSGAAPFPGLIVLQEAFGVNHHIRSVADRFAHEGYVAIAPELFHRTAPGFEGNYNDFASVQPHVRAVTREGASQDLRAAYDWLRGQSLVRKEEISCVGFCMGGRVAFVANATLPLRAAASFYGGGIAPAFLDLAPSLHGPMLFFWGEQDSHIPFEQRRQVIGAVAAAGKDYINVEISDAGHGFLCDERASYNARAASISWSMLLEFLRQPSGGGR